MSNSPTGAPAARPPRPAAVAFIFVTVFLDMMAFGVLIPILPLLVSEMAGGTTTHQTHVYGWFMFIWAAFQFLASPVLGALSDQVGRRPIILWSNVGVGLQFVILALAPNLAVMFAARILSGVSSASVATAYAYIADVTAPEKRPAAFGMMGAAFSAGFIIGPALGGALSEIGPRLPLWVAAGMSFVSALYGFFILPESLPKDRRTKFVLAKANPVDSMRFLTARPDLGGLASMHFLAQLAHVVFPAVFVLFAAQRLGFSAATIGAAMAGVGVLGIIVQAGLVGPVVKAVGERRALVFGLCAGALGFALYGAANSWAGLIAAMIVQAFWGFASPAAQALMTRRVTPMEQGKLQGSLQGLTSIGGLIGPLLYTYVFGFFVSDASPVLLPGAPFFLAAGLTATAAMIAWIATKPPQPA